MRVRKYTWSWCTSDASGAPFSLKSGTSSRSAEGSSTAPGEHVRAGLARLLEHGNRERLAALLLLQLRQPQRGRHPGGAAADDQDVDFEGFTGKKLPVPAPAPASVLTLANTKLVQLELFVQFRDHRRHDLEQVADDAVVGDLEDRRLGILVDRDDGARRPSCRRGAGSRRRCRARRRASAPRSVRSCRSGDPSAASRRRRSGATPRARRPSPARAASAIFRCSCALMPRPTATMRSACERSTACFASLNGASGFCRIAPASIVTSALRSGAGAAPRAAASARNAPIWNVTRCGAGPTASTSALSLPWNTGRTY